MALELMKLTQQYNRDRMSSFPEGAKTRPFAVTEHHHSAVLFVANNMPSLAKSVWLNVKRHVFLQT
jgi:hypothetical protein